MPHFKPPKNQPVTTDPNDVQLVKGTQGFQAAYSDALNSPVIPGVLARTGLPEFAADVEITPPWYDALGAAMVRWTGAVDGTDAGSVAYLTGIGFDGVNHPVGVVSLLNSGAGGVRAPGDEAGAVVQGFAGEGFPFVANPLPLGGKNPGGNVSALHTNAAGDLLVANAANGTLSNATVGAYAASLVISAAPATLKMLNGYNSAATAQFIQLFNAAALPANGVAPVAILLVQPGQNFSFEYGTEGRAFSAGIVVCNSSTGPTKTIGAADCWFDAQYKV